MIKKQEKLSERPELRELAAVIDGGIYAHIIGITEREEHRRRYTGNGHHLAQELVVLCTEAFLKKLPEVLENLGGLAIKTKSPNDIERFLRRKVFNAPVIEVIQSRVEGGSYKGRINALVSKISSACAKGVLANSFFIVLELSNSFRTTPKL